VNHVADGEDLQLVGGFEASADGARWSYAGALTFGNAARVFESVRELPLPSGGVVDLTGLRHADSGALAVLLALRRRSQEARQPLAFAAIPAGLQSLARVYGIDELLPTAA
jgi:phospholipid transport system transporter-binding protein